jgi:hypothetical protein
MPQLWTQYRVGFAFFNRFQLEITNFSCGSRSRGQNKDERAAGDITGRTFASVAQECEAGRPKGAFAPRAARGGPRFPRLHKATARAFSGRLKVGGLEGTRFHLVRLARGP